MGSKITNAGQTSWKLADTLTEAHSSTTVPVTTEELFVVWDPNNGNPWVTQFVLYSAMKSIATTFYARVGGYSIVEVNTTNGSVSSPRNMGGVTGSQKMYVFYR